MWWKLGLLGGLVAACAPISPRVDVSGSVPPPGPLDADGSACWRGARQASASVSARLIPTTWPDSRSSSTPSPSRGAKARSPSGTWRPTTELTVYLRVHGITDPRRAAVSLKVRGGKHTADDPDLASCVMLTFQAASTGARARFGKELSHPSYDYVNLTPHLDAALTDGAWVGLKMISQGFPGQHACVWNDLHVDTDPWDAAGRPSNRWGLPFSEYRDEEGTSIGRYETVADWGGWVTTVRADGVESLDFAILSAREIEEGRATLE
jgi:hypothetical protein